MTGGKEIAASLHSFTFVKQARNDRKEVIPVLLFATGILNVLYGAFPALSAVRQAQIYPDLSGPQD